MLISSLLYLTLKSRGGFKSVDKVSGDFFHTMRIVGINDPRSLASGAEENSGL